MLAHKLPAGGEPGVAWSFLPAKRAWLVCDYVRSILVMVVYHLND